MFETAVVRAHAADRRFGVLSFSLAIHIAAVATIIAASLASTQFPEEAPKQMLPFIVAPAVTIPPALGTPTPKPPNASATVVTAPVAPSTVAETLSPLPAAAESGPVAQPGRDTTVGVPWGEPGGINMGAPPAAAPDAAGPLQVGGEVKAPRTIRRIDPIYPRIALQARMSGWVVLRCVIDKAGRVRDVQVVNSSFAAFEEAGSDAVQQWLFAPGTLNGKPVDTIFELTVRFQVR